MKFRAGLFLDTTIMMDKESVVVTSGTSTLEAEEPDLVIYRLVGTIEGAEMRTLREAEGRWNAGKNHLLVMVDIRAMTGATWEARRLSAQEAMGTKNRAIAIFGAHPAIQTIADLTVRGIRVLSKGKMSCRFFSNEQLAREWLFAQRPHLIDYTKQQTIIDDRG
jgi:hypothetical protein